MFYLSSITIVNSTHLNNIYFMKFKCKVWMNSMEDIYNLKHNLEKIYNINNIAVADAYVHLSSKKYSKNQYIPRVYKLANINSLDGIEEVDDDI